MEPFAGGLNHHAARSSHGKHRIVGGSTPIAGHHSDGSTNGDGSSRWGSPLVTTDRPVRSRRSSVAASEMSTSRRRVRHERRNNSVAGRRCSEANELIETPGRISRCSLTVYGSGATTPRSSPATCVNGGGEKNADRMPPLTLQVHANVRKSRTMEESNRARTDDENEVADGRFQMQTERSFHSAGRRCICRCHGRRSTTSSSERAPTTLGTRTIPPTFGPPPPHVDDGREIPPVDQVTAGPSPPTIVTGPKQDSACSTHNTVVVRLTNSQNDHEHEVSSDHVNESRQRRDLQTGPNTVMETPHRQNSVCRNSCHDSERVHLKGSRSKRQEPADEAESERIVAPNGDRWSSSGSCIREESPMHTLQAHPDAAVSAEECAAHDKAAEIAQDINDHSAHPSVVVRRCIHSAPPHLASGRSRTDAEGFDPPEASLVGREHNYLRVAEVAVLDRASLSLDVVDLERRMDHYVVPSVDQELDAEVYETDGLSSLEPVPGASQFGGHIVSNEYDTGRCTESPPLAEDHHFATEVTSNSIVPLLELTANYRPGKHRRQGSLEAYRGSENFRAQFWRPYKLY